MLRRDRLKQRHRDKTAILSEFVHIKSSLPLLPHCPDGLAAMALDPVDPSIAISRIGPDRL